MKIKFSVFVWTMQMLECSNLLQHWQEEKIVGAQISAAVNKNISAAVTSQNGCCAITQLHSYSHRDKWDVIIHLKKMHQDKSFCQMWRIHSLATLLGAPVQPLINANIQSANHTVATRCI